MLGKLMPKGKDGLYTRNKKLFNFRYKDKNGAWHEKSTGKTNRAEARSVKVKFLELLQKNGLPTELAKYTVAQAVEHWLKGLEGEDLNQNTIRSYRTCLRQVTAVLGERRLDSISIADLREYRASRKKAGRANRTINHELLCFSQILREGKLWESVKEDYKPLKEKTKKSTRKPLSPAELNTLVATALTNPSWEVTLYVMLIAANTTARPIEISGLQLGRIHLGEYPYIDISRDTTKSDAGEREIPLNRIALLAIHKLLKRAHSLGAQEPEHYLLPANMARHTKENDPLYWNRFDGWNPNSHQKGWHTSWRKLRAKAGLPKVQFYQLRHTSITAGAEQNVPLAVMKSLAGHMDIKMTEYYTNVRDTSKAKAVAAIEQANPQLLVLLGIESGTDEKIQ
jgi:site-specific recombinase XerD